MEIYEKLKSRRIELNLTLEQVGEYVGVGKSTVRKWENGIIKDMKRSQIAKYAEILQISPAVILGISDEEYHSNSASEITGIRLPLYASICCGNGGFVDDNILEYISLPSTMLHASKDYFAQYAAGDSMIGAGINDGDLLVFEKSGHIDSGKIGCFCIDENEAMCKKYRVTAENQIYLMPANDKYDPILIDIENDHFRCLGILALVISKR